MLGLSEGFNSLVIEGDLKFYFKELEASKKSGALKKRGRYGEAKVIEGSIVGVFAKGNRVWKTWG